MWQMGFRNHKRAWVGRHQLAMELKSEAMFGGKPIEKLCAGQGWERGSLEGDCRGGVRKKGIQLASQ